MVVHERQCMQFVYSVCRSLKYTFYTKLPPHFMCFVLDFFFNSIPFFSLPVCLWNCDICAVLHTNQHFRDRPLHWIFAMSCHRPISSPAQCLEKFSSLTHTVSCNLDIFMRAIHDTEFPNSVDATQKLLDEQGAEYDRLKVSYKRWGVLVIWHLMPIFSGFIRRTGGDCGGCQTRRTFARRFSVQRN